MQGCKIKTICKKTSYKISVSWATETGLETPFSVFLKIRQPLENGFREKWLTSDHRVTSRLYKYSGARTSTCFISVVLMSEESVQFHEQIICKWVRLFTAGTSIINLLWFKMFSSSLVFGVSVPSLFQALLSMWSLVAWSFHIFTKYGELPLK